MHIFIIFSFFKNPIENTSKIFKCLIFPYQVGDISKKGWSNLAGNNVSSPNGAGYGGTSDNFNQSTGYQRSSSVGKMTNNGDDWNWTEEKTNSNNS